MTYLFAVLFAWISVGFWSSLAGFFLLLIKRDRYKITKGLPPLNSTLTLPSDFKTAILFPVYNEDPFMVAEGIKTVIRSLRNKQLDHHYDLFILSDSTNPDTWVTEEEVFYNTAKTLEYEKRNFTNVESDVFHENNLKYERINNSTSSDNNSYHASEKIENVGSLFYRHRQFNLKRKSGNIADFCRRWGKDYRYLIIFDADSLMSADCLARLVLTMEQRPDVGIIQTPPKAIFSLSLLSRVQQFANHLYGSIFAAGMHFWQLGDAQFWGHNAIIRTQPFMDYCQLPRLKGSSALSGDILSHDFVESALMRKGGYGVWLAYDMEGSFEMNPHTLTDELTRDRRWCQGNLQHIRLLFTKGFFPTHRALFLNGIMSYGSALLWFIFLVTSTVEVVLALITGPVYFPEGPSLFTDWPKYFPGWALALLSSTALLLFFPKILSFIYVLIHLDFSKYGGVIKLLISVFIEVFISTLLAPVRMLFHSYFVFMTFLGIKVGWNPQNRGGETGINWGSAIRVYWFPTILGVLWGLSMYVLSPGFFYWLSPVALSLSISVPLAVLTSRQSIGKQFFRLGLLLTPADTNPSQEIVLLEKAYKEELPPELLAIPRNAGFTRAILLPRTLNLHLFISGHNRKSFPAKAERLNKLIAKALKFGPSGLTMKDKKVLLNDKDSLILLHKLVWKLPSESLRLWGI
ncbi:MAG: glucans biosynthesis glucosyltransferase MdoH [Deltaproteobacteria bacterium]|jgi:membrane glycosyltransferase|nr:glucans biosynthesis glucosyltransferase MdoH [Deltaproteobacteria bacterium]